MPSNAEPTQAEIMLFSKCTAIIAGTIAIASRMDMEQGHLDVAQDILTGKHNGIVGEDGQFIRAIFLEQNKKNMSEWRIRMVVNNGDGGKDSFICNPIDITAEEIPTSACVDTAAIKSWLLFPDAVICPTHAIGKSCPHCDGQPSPTRLFDEKILVVGRMMILSITKSDKSDKAMVN